MRKFFSLHICFALLLLPLFFNSARGAAEQKIHPCSGAGLWFEPTKERLTQQVNSFLQQAPAKPISGKVVALIAPHAGYPYAGKTMATAYKTIRGAHYDRVIILAFSHSMPVNGISVSDYTAYETPLGTIPVDTALASKLRENSLFSASSFSHIREHSDENQLPFLQTVLKDFKILPLHVSDLAPDQMDKAAACLKQFITPSTLVIASSDFTHYGEAFGYVPFRTNIKENLYALDGEAIRLICAKDYLGFETFLREKRSTICGQNPIRLLLRTLDKDAKGELLAYMTSGEVDGNYSRSVGYAAIVFSKPEQTQPKPAPSEKAPEAKPSPAPKTESPAHSSTRNDKSPLKLSLDEQKTILRLARESLVSLVTSQRKPEVNLSTYRLTDRLKEKSALYVTLYKNNAVRGRACFAKPEMPLYEALIDRVEAAAFYHPQYKMVSPDELPTIDIEITVNGPARRIKTPEEINFGSDGAMIFFGKQAGIIMPFDYLPWAHSPEDVLGGVCRVASLQPDAWKKRRAKILAFPCETFRESDLLGRESLQTNLPNTESLIRTQ
jgi:AmmeMemoRadiSam system protein B/uncharacterized protein (TIGR00296 family)